MNDVYRKFLYGDTLIFIRGLRDIAEMCCMDESGGGNATPPPPNELGLMSGRSKPDESIDKRALVFADSRPL